jgi:hypothetical protein
MLVVVKVRLERDEVDLMKYALLENASNFISMIIVETWGYEQGAYEV